MKSHGLDELPHVFRELHTFWERFGGIDFGRLVQGEMWIEYYLGRISSYDFEVFS